MLYCWVGKVRGKVKDFATSPDDSKSSDQAGQYLCNFPRIPVFKLQASEVL